jgi:hypothetical protein
MLESAKLDEPFNKLPPDGPLQKIKISSQVRRDSTHSPKPLKSEVKVSSVELISRELEKSKQREKLLREELMVRNRKMSARIINEQDKIIAELREKVKDGMMDDLNYLEGLKNEADILAWSSELMLSQDEPGDPPSMDDIIPVD